MSQSMSNSPPSDLGQYLQLVPQHLVLICIILIVLDFTTDTKIVKTFVGYVNISRIVSNIFIEN